MGKKTAHSDLDLLTRGFTCRMIRHCIFNIEAVYTLCCGSTGALTGIWPPSLFENHLCQKGLARRSSQRSSCLSYIRLSFSRDGKLHFMYKEILGHTSIITLSLHTTDSNSVFYNLVNGAVVRVWKKKKKNLLHRCVGRLSVMLM